MGSLLSSEGPAISDAWHGEGLNDLPPWACQERWEFSIADNVRPVIPKLRCVIYALIFTQSGIFLAVRWSASCQDGGGYPTFPTLIWAGSLPALVYRNYIGWEALQLYLAPYVFRVDEMGMPAFKVFDFPVSYMPWLAFYVVCSNLNYLDIITDSIFAAVAHAASQCPGNHMEELWRISWQQSGFGRVGVPVINFSLLVVGFWLMSFLQMIVPLVMTKEAENDSPDSEETRALRLRMGSEGSMTLGGEKLYDDDKVAELSEAAGLATIQSLAISTRLSNESNSSVAVEARPLSSLYVKRFFLTYIAENAAQVNLQSSLFAIDRRVTAGKWGWPATQALLSLVLGLGLTMMKIAEATSFLKFARLVERGWQTEACEHSQDDMDDMDKFRRNVRIVYGLVIFLCLSLAYAVLKLLMAFVCHDSLVNLTGCVDASAFHSNTTRNSAVLDFLHSGTLDEA